MIMSLSNFSSWIELPIGGPQGGLTRNASKRYIDEMVHLLNGGLIRVLSRI